MLDKGVKFFLDGTDRFASRVVNRGFWAIATFPLLKVNKKSYSIEDFTKEVPFAVAYSIGASLFATALGNIYNLISPPKHKKFLQHINSYIHKNPSDMILTCGVLGLGAIHLKNISKKYFPIEDKNDK